MTLLSARQRQVLELYAELESLAVVADDLGLARQTIKNHLGEAYRTLDVTNSIGAFKALGWLGSGLAGGPTMTRTERRAQFWKLEDHTPVPTYDLGRWGTWMEQSRANRRVAQDQVDEAWVSTVFLGTDYNYGSGGQPILFETMIFGGLHDRLQWRYSTWEQAAEGHESVVAALRNRKYPDVR